MKQVIIALLFTAGTAFAAEPHKGLESTEPVKQASIDSKKALVVYNDGPYGCPDGFDTYVMRVKPPVDKAHPENQQGDFQSYLYVQDGNVLISRSSQPFKIACLREKK